MDATQQGTEVQSGIAAQPVVPKGKRTALGLYVSAKEAYARWVADPETCKIIDVRTPEEYLFVGHPTMAWNIPAFVQSYEWDTAKHKFPMQPIPDFVGQVKQVAGAEDTLLVTCRSGGRAALAVNMLAQAGFAKVYNIVDGVEGDVVTDPDSLFKGQHLVNGWKNAGLPWTYEPDPERMLMARRA